MPIRINLLAEAQAEEEQKRRDPAKLAGWLGGFAVFLVLLWAFSVYLKVGTARSTLVSRTTKWKSIEKKFAEVTDTNKKLGDVEKRLGALYRFSTNRFLWGPVLGALQESTADKVQVARIKTTQACTPVAATIELTFPAKIPGGPPTKIPAKPAAAIERISLTLDARDYADLADQNFNKFRERLAEEPYLKPRLTKPESVRLANLSAAGVSPLDPGRTFQTFTIECEFPEVRRE
jgi:hypothetical protein